MNSEIQFAEGKHFHSSEECNFRLVHSGMFGPLCLVPTIIALWVKAVSKMVRCNSMYVHSMVQIMH